MLYDFKFGTKYLTMLEEIGVNVELILREVGIPPKAITNEKYKITNYQYKRILEAFDRSVNIELLVNFSKLESVAVFVPEFFAGLCADNGLNCLNRIAKYKKIIAPVNMIIEQTAKSTSISYVFNDGDRLSRAVLMNAHISIISIIRQGTGRSDISPTTILTEYEYPSNAIEYIGVDTKLSKENKIIFSNEDLKVPFVTENNRMWNYLESELNQKLEKIESSSNFLPLLRKTLLELVPSGITNMEQVAYELGMSKRTLGRRLNEEGTTYKIQLNEIRELLVYEYLKTEMTLDEIAFLVNYLDAKSLSRAFKTWTGINISKYRKENLNI